MRVKMRRLDIRSLDMGAWLVDTIFEAMLTFLLK